jgi:hypothetical protein
LHAWFPAQHTILQEIQRYLFIKVYSLDFCTAAHLVQSSFSLQGMLAPTPVLTVPNNPPLPLPQNLEPPPSLLQNLCLPPLQKPRCYCHGFTVAVRAQLRHALYRSPSQPSTPTVHP